MGVSAERGIRKTWADGWSLWGGLGAEESLVEIATDLSRTDCWVQHASFEAISCFESICGNLFF